MKKSRIQIGIIILLISTLLASCNLPRSEDQAPVDRDSINTSVAQTVTANAMQTGDGDETQMPGPTLTPSTPSGETQAPTEAPPATETPLPSDTPEPSETPLPCNRAEFVKDITVPDGKKFEMGDTFTKTWRLENTGTCAWTSGYDIVFVGGDKMGAPDSVQITTDTVDPGDEVDISVDLTAPSTPGTYRGNWKLRDPEGVIFGIENSSSGYFWVEIEVQEPGPEVKFDFYDEAPSAEWVSGAGTLSFGGPDSDPDGFAMYKDGADLEDGSSPGGVIETHPQWVNNGVISGKFPSYTVENGDHFKAKIGFIALGDGSCGVGNVKYQFNYKKGGTLYPLGSWNETCDGSLTALNIDLSSLAGETVRFVFAVQANGPASQDWAVWVNPRIEN